MTNGAGPTIPLPPAEAPPTKGSGSLRLLEMFLFAAVFIAGGVLTYLAAFGETEPASAENPPASPPPVAAPSPAVTPPAPGEPSLSPTDPGTIPGVTGLVQFSGARNEIGTPVGCTAHIEYIWEIDRDFSPPLSGRALIEVDGPGVSGDYDRPVQGDEIRLALDVDITNGGVFEANVVSVGETPAFPTPLPASFTDAAC